MRHKTPPASRPLIRLALIEDETLLREAMKTLLKQEPGFVVAGDAGGRIDGLKMIARVNPDILLLDINLGEDSGLDMLQEIKVLSPRLRCLVLTGLTDDHLILKAVRGAADGFMLKSCSIQALVRAIRLLATGQKAWSNDLLIRMAALDTPPHEDPKETGMASLDAIEFRIAGLVSEGLTNREIGVHLALAEKTIRNRISIIMEKLPATRRSRIAALFIHHREEQGKRKSLSLTGVSPSMMGSKSISNG